MRARAAAVVKLTWREQRRQRFTHKCFGELVDGRRNRDADVVAQLVYKAFNRTRKPEILTRLESEKMEAIRYSHSVKLILVVVKNVRNAANIEQIDGQIAPHARNLAGFHLEHKLDGRSDKLLIREVLRDADRNV